MIATGEEALAEFQARLAASGFPMPTLFHSNVPNPPISQQTTPPVPNVPDDENKEPNL